MTTSQIIFSIYVYSLIAVYFGTLWKIFEKSGVEKWKGFVPGYNLFVWIRTLKNPWWWILFFLPDFLLTFEFGSYGIGFLSEFVVCIMIVVLNVQTARMFRKFSWQETLKFILLPHWGLIELAYGDATYYGEGSWQDEAHREERKWGDHVALFFSLPVVSHIVVILMGLGSKKVRSNGKTLVKEWTDAILFAVVAASIIRTFVFEPFTIPTPSMEKDLLVGDYLFVSKMSYGTKLPNTPLGLPFFHNYIPVIGTDSYVEWIKRPYRRIPGFGSVDRNDVVVFNFPAGDTAIFDPGVEGLMGHTYSQILVDYALQGWIQDGGRNLAEFEKVKKTYTDQVRKGLQEKYGLIYRPVDKRENYIKRCVAVAGDELQIVDGQLMINGSNSEAFEDMQYNYIVNLPQPLSDGILEHWKENFGITPSQYAHLKGSLRLPVALTKENYDKFKGIYGDNLAEDIGGENVLKSRKDTGYYHSMSSQVEGFAFEYGMNPGTQVVKYFPIFPNHPKFNWTEDNFGPLKIPAAGWTVELTAETWILYERCIKVHEGHETQRRDGKFFIDGQEVTSYTFEMDYYWMMGDNRHQSADSRFWGFVPEDHVVGKGVFIWMSKDPEEGWFQGGIRWNRLFSVID